MHLETAENRKLGAGTDLENQYASREDQDAGQHDVRVLGTDRLHVAQVQQEHPAADEGSTEPQGRLGIVKGDQCFHAQRLPVPAKRLLAVCRSIAGLCVARSLNLIPAL